MDLEREIDRLIKRLDARLIGPEVTCHAIKHLVRSHFSAQTTSGKLMVFEQFVESLFERYRFLEIGSAAMGTDIKARLGYLRDTPSEARPKAEVVWL